MSRKRIILLSASADICLALANHWLDQGHEIIGTYRLRSAGVNQLEQRGATLIPCDFSDIASTKTAMIALQQYAANWDALIMGHATQNPVGNFASVDFDAWEDSILLNFSSQMRSLHALLPSRNQSAAQGPLVLFFAGGGTNNATVNYSAYTLAKIALIKMCELLDAEIPDTRFTILGPGWVKTKIHEATLQAGETKAGLNFEKTKSMLAGDQCNPMGKVVACCDWVLEAERCVGGGRNFSVVHDAWGNPDMEEALRQDPQLYKLRRSGNALKFIPKETP